MQHVKSNYFKEEVSSYLNDFQEKVSQEVDRQIQKIEESETNYNINFEELAKQAIDKVMKKYLLDLLYKNFILKKKIIEMYKEDSESSTVSQNEDIEDKESKMLNIKLKLLESELNRERKDNTSLIQENSEFRRKLENIQRHFQNINKQKISTPLSNDALEDSKENLTFGSHLDGSIGLSQYCESGRFGSFPSFDNYSDNFKEDGLSDE